MNARIIFSKKLKEIRQNKNLTQEKLAEISGLHRTYIGAVERGERNITIEVIEKIAKALETPIYIFFKEN